VRNKLPTVSIIFTNFNGGSNPIKCLQSIKKLNYPKNKLEVIMVDNHSTDKSATSAKKRFPWVKIIYENYNLGFAGGINDGIKKSKSEYVFITNDDIIFEKNSILNLVQQAKIYHHSILGGRVLELKKKELLGSGRNFNFWTGLQETIKNGKENQECVYVQGCSMLVAKNDIQKIGLFDKNFFPAYFEDVDFCQRAKKAGYKIIYCPKAIFYHQPESTFKRLPPRKAFTILFKNRNRFILKHASLPQILISSLIYYFITVPYRILRGEDILLPVIDSLIYTIKNLKKIMSSRIKLKKKEILNIALVTQVLDIKSGSRAPVELAKALSKNHHLTIFAVQGDIKIKEELENRGIKVYLLKESSNLSSNILAMWRFFRLMQKTKPEIISFHATLPYLLISKFTGAHIVVTYYGTQFDAYLERNSHFKKRVSPQNIFLNKILNALIWTKMKTTTLIADQLVAISRYTQKEARRLYNTLIKMVYLSGSTSLKFGKQKTSSKNFTILSISRFTPYKGFEKIINVFKSIERTFPSVRLIIAGSTQNEQYLKFLKSKVDSKIKIYQNPTDEELSHLYSFANCFVSYDRYPFFGMAICEAENYGIPIIAYKKCAASELVEHKKNGFLFKNEKELELYLKLLIQDSKLCQSLGNSALMKAKQFSWEKTANEYERIFRECLKK